MASGGQKAGASLSGALAGAGAGAALGSVVPGIGTAVGAVGGALIGGLGSYLSLGGDDDEQPSLVSPEDVARANQQVQSASTQQNQALLQQQAFLRQLQGHGGLQNQSQVYQQLQQQYAGEGPNAALEMIRQQTGQNVAQQAALLASQRGASGNIGLLSRQAAMQGQAAQQNAIAQAAALQAQQSQQALGQAGSIAGQQAQQQLAGQQLYAGQVTAAQNAALQQQSNVLGAGGSAAGRAQQQSQFDQDRTDRLIGQGLQQAGQLASTVGKFSAPSSAPVAKQGTPVAGQAYSNPSVMAAAKGGEVPGKAEVKGDSLKNDKIPALLSPGEVVIPRSVMNSKDPAKKAADFVAAILAKRGLKK